MEPYQHATIEPKWQKNWEEAGIFHAEDFSAKPKFYGLIEFPYPSGEGLHVGHLRSYTAMDVIARKRRMQGYNVLFPIGFDAFGLPAENYAIKTGIHPKITTETNIANFTRQLKSLGYSFDWNRVINTSEPTYYKWTQWIFLKLFEHGLAYKAEAPTNWCTSCQVTLAHEEVVGGKCERCGNDVETRLKQQWLLKITAYADRLIHDLESLDFLPIIKEQQINWIGRSEGAEVVFHLKDSVEKIAVFTTRPDTIFGVTYLVLAPEHLLVKKITTETAQTSVQAYIRESLKKSERERQENSGDKTGVFTGSFALHPFTKKPIPIWISDYVLASYGTGAVMAVPAHDFRDWAFAQKFHLPVRPVVQRKDASVRSFLMGGGNITSQDLEKLGILIQETTQDGYFKIIIPNDSIQDYEQLITDKMEPSFWNEYIGQESVFIFKDTNGKTERIVLTEETEELIDKLAAQYNGEDWTKCENPWAWLAANDWYKPLIIHEKDGVNYHSDFLNGVETKEAKKEVIRRLESEHLGRGTITYKLRDWVFSRQRYWGEPIPMIECPHCGWVPVPENALPVELPPLPDYKPSATGESPLANVPEWVNTSCPKCGVQGKRETDTMPQWAGSSWYFLRYCDPHNDAVLGDWEKLRYFLPVDWYNGGAEHITLHLLYSRFWHKFLYDIGATPVSEPYQKRTLQGMILGGGGVKMSKSKGNVINPDAYIQEFGADTTRMYILFMGPFDQAIAWDHQGTIGVRRFLDKVWQLPEKLDKQAQTAGKEDLMRLLHKLIQKVGEDIESMRFNTAIAACMGFINELQKTEVIPLNVWEGFLVVLSPFAPHLAEELWSRLGHKDSILLEPWPTFDPDLMKDETVEVVIQINGKLRDRMTTPADISEDEAQTLALSREKVQPWIKGKTVEKVILVPKRLINIVTNKTKD